MKNKIINSGKRVRVWMIACLVICSSAGVYSQPTESKVDSSFDLYLLVGQSNMAGRGVVTEDYQKISDPQVMMLDKENHWVQAHHPLHFDKPGIAGVGPGLSFGIEMAKNSNGHKIGLIPCAVGGTSIMLWQPGGYDKVTDTHPYDDAVKRLDTAMRSGVIKGVIWLQGESDTNPERSKEYLSRLTALITTIRMLANNDKLPFVAGQLGRFKEQYSIINAELAKLITNVPFTALVSSEGLVDKGDLTHFDSPSADLCGKRFAEQMKILLQKN